MLTAERGTPRITLPTTIRRSPGFTLGEATQIRRDILSHKPVLECPRCAGKMDTVRAGDSEDAFWIAGCTDCGLSVVVHCRAGDLP